MDNKKLNAQSEYMEKDPPCMYCQHLTAVGDNSEFNGWTCSAFPKGIPQVILKKRIRHKTILDFYPGQATGDLFKGREKNDKVYDYDGNLI